ncbi:hypothetical protein GCK72_002055 [Caenorhabditis remanei]|uniref:Tyrosine-protein kinase n=1 Tax=Caenorhabditis remanei TaxID=31234 RepID=A0A6A5HVF0_CAERE|nr:hypothetical protein GCK72_002055 [Caenorhabditis remanei]KAF1770237.1 hypothetical protein GCK72_002055 [Caenorhabditis remanei]
MKSGSYSNESGSSQNKINKRLRKHTRSYSSERVINNEQYYHGLLPRADVRLLLKENGDFVVRITEPKPGEQRSYVLSVLHDKLLEENAAVKHLVIHSANQKFWIDNTFSFESPQALISYYLKPAVQNEETAVVRLLRPISRQPWELEHEWITIKQKLGQGAFGEVSMGIFKRKGMIKGVQVAVKQAKLEKMGKEQIKEFMCEARHLKTMSHPNIVKFYGVAVLEEPLYMVMELASNGALDSYLKKNPNLPVETRNEMILQAAWGLEYLHSRPVLHRDIAARNCLYGDQKVKISDFGLTRTGSTYQMDMNKKVPIRWLAMETLITGSYTQKADVWAYGIMCWEIYNSAIEPYPGMSPAEVHQKVREGYRMQIPVNVHPDIQKTIQSCWLENAADRPTMSDIATQLQNITQTPRPNFSAI